MVSKSFNSEALALLVQQAFVLGQGRRKTIDINNSQLSLECFVPSRAPRALGALTLLFFQCTAPTYVLLLSPVYREEG